MNLSQMIDALYEAREERMAADRHTQELKKKENRIKETIIAEMQKQDMTACGGHVGKVTLRIKDKPVAQDWEAIHHYIKEHDAFDLMQKRLTESAVAVRWEDGLEVPGIGVFPVPVLSLSRSN